MDSRDGEPSSKVPYAVSGRIRDFFLVELTIMEKRLGFIGIIIDDRRRSAAPVNAILSDYGEMIVARTGVPHRANDRSVITLVIEANTDELGKLTGRLGQLPGVSVKSALSKK